MSSVFLGAFCNELQITVSIPPSVDRNRRRTSLTNATIRGDIRVKGCFARLLIRKRKHQSWASLEYFNDKICHAVSGGDEARLGKATNSGSQPSTNHVSCDS